ncbi:MAG: CBS domain-containing protein [Desulfurococcaceae archaeon]|nr:CBS domain-containing protein [Desulfurococcaceae archaeon]
MKLPNPRRMYERARWLRSDGKPNFASVVRSRQPELKALVDSNVPVVSPQTPLLNCIEEMYRRRFRAVLVAKSNLLSGIITFHDIADYLGGGYRHRVALERYGANLFKALSIASQELMNRNPTYVTLDTPLERVLELMVVGGFGLVPVTDNAGRPLGAVTEGSVVRVFSWRVGRRPVENFMTRNVVVSEAGGRLGDVLKLMVSTGVRRVPLVGEGGSIQGVVSWRSVVDYIGSHRVFENLREGLITEFLELRSVEVADRDIVVVEPETPLEQLTQTLLDRGLDYALVARGGELVGIITERDIMYAVVGG